MLRCTYIVLIHNNESNITKLVDSLKMIAGNFHKEFIFVVVAVLLLKTVIPPPSVPI